MKYIKELNIKSFRGIKELELLDLGEVNILVGKNNSGKTSILEAIGILEKPKELGNIIRIGRKREILNNQSSPYSIFKNMLNNLSKSMHIMADIKGQKLDINVTGKTVSVITEKAYSQEIEGFQGEISGTYGEEIIFKEININQMDQVFLVDKKDKIISMEYITPVDHLLQNTPNDVIKKGSKKELIQLLSIFDKDINGLEMIEENKITVPYVEHKKLGLMPLSTYGDGLKKVLLLGASIIKAERGILLIDEVETAIHIDALVDVFKWFVKACEKYKVQVFMTTHSIEVIDSILESKKIWIMKNF
ncbi:hypothetical protein Q428_12425 [Fervidicella metallireducens AeB]|uniref:Uncharacterized protein n=1 Tax=Fervidicella metallireducens AeB TaxID=1403537 RepID=A0A017RT40_9CLOT|nr:ATP-binding protein [Fervidicella metallireducens]EYE87604.1 hypothetical protein Q428_12425 [Fervidicella metallireducens AeB]